MKIKHIILVLFIFVGSLSASNFNYFSPEHFGKPFVSNIRSSIIKFEEGFINDLGDFYYIDGYQKRLFSESHVGTDIPFISYRNKFGKAYVKSTFLLTGAFNVILDSMEPSTRMDSFGI